MSGLLSPKTYYGTQHDYVYYPSSWTDTSTGTTYEQGYYDENGQYYESVAFAKDGRYENVICHCDYCGQDVALNLDATQDALTNLKCPNCTAPLTVKSKLDEDATSNSATAYDAGGATAQRAVKKKRKWPWIVLAILVALYIIGDREQKRQELEDPTYGSGVEQLQPAEYAAQMPPVPEGEPIYLKQTGENSYTYAGSGSYDKILVWDDEINSYFDAETDCWLWFNIDVEPPVWQYWVEGISSDYGDYGWMEHAGQLWYIEAENGRWTVLPGSYDTGDLWYIE